MTTSKTAQRNFKHPLVSFSVIENGEDRTAAGRCCFAILCQDLNPIAVTYSFLAFAACRAELATKGYSAFKSRRSSHSFVYFPSLSSSSFSLFAELLAFLSYPPFHVHQHQFALLIPRLMSFTSSPNPSPPPLVVPLDFFTRVRNREV